MNATEPLLIAGGWRDSVEPVGRFRAVDPSSGTAIGPAFPRSGPADVECAVTAAEECAQALAATEPARIAEFLDRYAAGIEASTEALVSAAHSETALPVAPRLSNVELPRTADQLRQAALAVRTYAWTHPVVDTRAGLRSHFAPLGKPVLVFGPNNFPFAFNAVAGSDFASAIAARNPVIAKAHPSHPLTSQLLARIAHTALLEAGLPSCALQLLYDIDREQGIALAGDARLGAVGFTGSRRAGLALKAAADAAGVPIYAEMSSVNPVFLLSGALAERGDTLAREFFASCTLGGGQFCTNPGVIVVPDGPAGDAFASAAASHFSTAAPAVLFSADVQQQLASSVAVLRNAGARLLAGTGEGAGPGFRFLPTLLTVDARAFLRDASTFQTEAFGPVALLVRCDRDEVMAAVAARFEGSLTGTLHAAQDGADETAWRNVAAALRPRVGRLIADKWPTGVAVSPAMQHGGPYPSTGHPGFTSVGMPAAIRRFAALQCYDQVHDELLPPELRDANPMGIQRLVDGIWTQERINGGRAA